MDAQASLRRSRRHAQPPLPPPAKEEGETLECADEKQVSSDEEMDEEAALNAIVGRLEEEMEDEEPSAVNLEVAPTGKVTARKDDGTRVSTPGATPTSTGGTRAASSPRTQGTPHRHKNLARSLSYAAAMASTPCKTGTLNSASTDSQSPRKTRRCIALCTFKAKPKPNARRIRLDRCFRPRIPSSSRKCRVHRRKSQRRLLS